MEFQLGGQNYILSKEEVEDRLKHIEPEDVRKHYAVVEGRRFPVKQALSAAIDRPVTDFITTDAIRIFTNLGFEVDNVKEQKPMVKTTSELRFEEYLKSNGLGYFQFEKEIRGTSRRPDYSLTFMGQEILFEVKEFKSTGDEVKNDNKAHTYDPYLHIREKIGAGRKKFKDLESYCCCLVLWNEEKPLVFLEWPELIYGAMLGDLAIRIPIEPAGQYLVTGESQAVYSAQGGKMVHKEGQQVVVENRTISAVLVLEDLDVGQRRFGVEVRRAEKEGKKLSPVEFFEMFERAKGTEKDYGLKELRISVYENPYARKRPPAEMFRGPYDKRYGLADGYVTLLFAGARILDLERLEASFPERRLEEYLRRDVEGP